MIAAIIRLSDCAATANFDSGVLQFGESRIECFHHQALENGFIKGNQRWLLWVREASSHVDLRARKDPSIIEAPNDDQFSRELNFNRAWPFDFTTIECAFGPGGIAIKIQVGKLGAAPLYFTLKDGRLFISWDFAWVRSHAKDRSVDFHLGAHFLAMKGAYTSRTLIQSVRMLTERASLVWSDERADIVYPSSAEAPIRSELRNDVDPAEIISRLVCHAMAGRRIQSADVKLELSGGLDSAVVAILATKVFGPNLESAGIMLEGRDSSAQERRRLDIINAIKLRDFEVRIEEYPPTLCKHRNPLNYKYLLSETYFDAFWVMWQELSRNRDVVLMGGYGGDELFPTYSDEASDEAIELQRTLTCGAYDIMTNDAIEASRSNLFDLAPTSYVPATSLVACGRHSPLLLTMGIWPVNPLCDPTVVSFCHRLPLTFRAGRTPFLDIIKRATTAGSFAGSYEKETFLPATKRALLEEIGSLRKFFDRSLLVELRLLDRERMRNKLDKVRSGQDENYLSLITAVHVEQFLRSVFQYGRH